MPRANEIKKGMVLNYNGKLLIVKDIDIQAPSARGAATLYKMRFADVRTGLKVEERFKGDDIVDTVTLTRRYVDFSYIDGNEYVFMDKEDYTPYIFTKDQIEEELLFIPEGGMPDMQVLTWDGQLLALELPQTVVLEIVETTKPTAELLARLKDLRTQGFGIALDDFVLTPQSAQFLEFANFHYVSALKGLGLSAVFRSVDAAYRAATADLSTPRLTRTLIDAVARQSPPRNGIFRPKLRYAHQGGRNPPVVVVHGNALDKVPDSYKRYLERVFREVFKLQGTPLRIQFNVSENPYAETKPAERSRVRSKADVGKSNLPGKSRAVRSPAKKTPLLKGKVATKQR